MSIAIGDRIYTHWTKTAARGTVLSVSRYGVLCRMDTGWIFSFTFAEVKRPIKENG